MNLVYKHSLESAEMKEICFKNNLDLNCIIASGKFNFLSGSWESLFSCQELPQQQFDFILASETIYRKEVYLPILKLMEKYLKPAGKM